MPDDLNVFAPKLLVEFMMAVVDETAGFVAHPTQ
jgi:hypothetical protein